MCPNKHLGFVLCSRVNLKEARGKRDIHCNASNLILFEFLFSSFLVRRVFEFVFCDACFGFSVFHFFFSSFKKK